MYSHERLLCGQKELIHLNYLGYSGHLLNGHSEYSCFLIFLGVTFW